MLPAAPRVEVLEVVEGLGFRVMVDLVHDC